MSLPFKATYSRGKINVPLVLVRLVNKPVSHVSVEVIFSTD
jgi:hypothetical protein